jgi:hypothetical protein
MAKDEEQGHARAGEQERVTGSTCTDETQVGPVGGSSRDSLAGAGWTCREVGKFRGLISAKSRPFSWLSLAPLWRSGTGTDNPRYGALLGGHLVVALRHIGCFDDRLWKLVTLIHTPL